MEKVEELFVVCMHLKLRGKGSNEIFSKLGTGGCHHIKCRHYWITCCRKLVIEFFVVVLSR
jgi:hypothetical protein